MTRRDHFPFVAKVRRGDKGAIGETVFYCDATHARADQRKGLRRRRVFPVRLGAGAPAFCGHCGRFLG